MIEGTDPSFFSAGIRMFWGLFVVLGILLVIYGLMRKKLSHIKNNDNSAIKIKEIRHIMPKKSICLVEVNDQEFLLGLGTESITFLSAVPSKDSECFEGTLASIEQKKTHES